MDMPKITHTKYKSTMSKEAKERYITKMAKTIEVKEEVFGEEAQKIKFKGKEVKGENNYFLGKALGHKY